MTLGLEHERDALLGLQPPERLRRPRRAVKARDPLLVGGKRRVLVRIQVGLDVAHEGLAAGADRQRLVLDDGPQPREHGGGLERLGPPQEDLERALVGVVGVVGAQRVAPRGGQQRWGVLADDGEHELATFGRPGNAAGRAAHEPSPFAPPVVSARLLLHTRLVRVLACRKRFLSPSSPGKAGTWDQT